MMESKQKDKRHRLNLFSSRTWLTALLASLVVCAILLLPHPLSDVVLIGATAAGIGWAVIQLETVWLYFFLVFPLVNLSGNLFGIYGVLVSRILAVGLSLVVLLKYRDRPTLLALVRSNGFRFLALFILANLIAAVRVLQTYAFSFTLTYLDPLLFFALSYFVVYRNRENLPRLLSAILISGTVSVMVGFYEIATQQSVAAWLNANLNSVRDIYMYQSNSDRFGLGGRISSLIGQPVFASLYLTLLPIIGLYYFETTKRARWMAALFGVACVVLVLATGTRGGLVALTAGVFVLLVFGLRDWKQRLIALALSVGLGLLVLLALPQLGTYLVRSVDVGSATVESRNIVARISLTRELLRYFQNNWLLGYGPGLFQRQAQLGIIPTVDGIHTLGGMENQYAAILVDGGILAGLAYLLFMGGVVWDAVRMIRQPRWRMMGLTLLALFAAYFVFAGTELALIAIPNLILMAVYGAFAAEFESAPEAKGGQSWQTAVSPVNTLAKS